ncbi:hypothetical protein [Nonomuraea sp. NPDC049400]|uniref:hypothetical protein n=1 Tax=Nonomuraea sp. NPDC049400 TaxID=3364352 RepID=UPI00379B69CD
MGMALSIIPTAGVSASVAGEWDSAASAASAARTLYGSCKTPGESFYANVEAYYTPRDNKDHISTIKFYLGSKGNHQLGTKNNATLRIREARNNAPDRSLWTWISKDNIPKGWTTKSVGIAVNYSVKWHADFEFTFDRSGGDPKCSGRTSGA